MKEIIAKVKVEVGIGVYAILVDKESLLSLRIPREIKDLKHGDCFRLHYADDGVPIDDTVYIAQCDAYRKGETRAVSTTDALTTTVQGVRKSNFFNSSGIIKVKLRRYYC
jgi:hypothetical protein